MSKRNQQTVIALIVGTLFALGWIIVVVFRGLAKLFSSPAGVKPASKPAPAKAPEIKVTITGPDPSAEPYSSYTKEQAQANKLASQAVQLKESNISGAVALLQEARSLWPDNTEITFRLARYLRKAGRPDDAFAIYRELCLKVDRDDFFFYGFNYEAIYAEMLKQLFEEKKYREYLYYYFFDLWAGLLGLAAQGRYRGVDEDLLVSEGVKTKLARALKAEGLLDQQKTLSAALYSALQEYEPDLERMSDIAEKNEFPEAGDQRSVLAENEEYMRLFDKLARLTIAGSLYKKTFGEGAETTKATA